MREAHQAPGSRKGPRAQIRVLLIELLISFPEKPAGNVQRAFREGKSHMNCLGWKWPTHPHPGDQAWSRDHLYWCNTSHAFRHQQAVWLCGCLQRSIVIRVGSWSYPMVYKGFSQMISFFSN